MPRSEMLSYSKDWDSNAIFTPRGSISNQPEADQLLPDGHLSRSRTWTHIYQWMNVGWYFRQSTRYIFCQNDAKLKKVCLEYLHCIQVSQHNSYWIFDFRVFRLYFCTFDVLLYPNFYGQARIENWILCSVCFPLSPLSQCLHWPTEKPIKGWNLNKITAVFISNYYQA